MKTEAMTARRSQKQLQGVIASGGKARAGNSDPGRKVSWKCRASLVKKEEKALALLGDLNKLFIDIQTKNEEF